MRTSTRELDHERILVLVHHSGRGKTSELELEMRSHGAALFPRPRRQCDEARYLCGSGERIR